MESKTSISLILLAPFGRAHLSGPRTVYALLLVYKRESALVRTQALGSDKLSQVTHTESFPKLSQAIQIKSGRRVLRSGSPNHSKSSCLSRVHPSFDQALLGLPQTLPKLGLGGCNPPPGWRFPPTFGAPGRGPLGLVRAWSKLKTAMARENRHHDLLLGEEVASSTPHATRRTPSRWQRVLHHGVLWSGPPWSNRCLHQTGRSWQPGSCSATRLVRQPRLMRRGSGVTTSTASSIWYRCNIPNFAHA
jgi:hypothetical protein